MERVGKKTGKRIPAMLILSFLCAAATMTGCEYPELNISQETPPVIEQWLSYKAQVEDTTPFATESTSQDTDNSTTLTETTVRDEENEPEPQEDPQPDVMDQESTRTMAPAEGQHGFYYQYLSDSARVIYDEILVSLVSHRNSRISTLSTDQADLAFQCVLYDHPEIFYVTGYHLTQKTMDGQVVELMLEGQYEYTEDEIARRQGEIDAYVAEFLSGMPDTQDEYEKVKFVYDHLIMNTSYNLAAPDNQNICSVFIGGESVCQGYSEAAQYLLREAGIESSIVTGLVNGGGRHAWNIVKVNGSYYYMDATWGDVDYRAADDGQYEEKLVPVNYDYFLVTTLQLEKSHVIDTIVTMPACVSLQDNYYVREGLYFENVDESKIATAFQKAYEKGQNAVTLKCADDIVYGQMRQYLVEDNHVFEYMDALESISYSEDVNMYTLCFWL